MKTVILSAFLVLIVLAAILRMVWNVKKGNSFCGAILEEPIKTQNEQEHKEKRIGSSTNS